MKHVITVFHKKQKDIQEKSYEDFSRIQFFFLSFFFATNENIYFSCINIVGRFNINKKFRQEKNEQKLKENFKIL